MLKYTKEEEKTMMMYENLKSEAGNLEEYLQTEDFRKLPHDSRADKVMNLHHMKQHLSELSDEIAKFVPTEVVDKPAKPTGLGEGINDNPENLN